MINILKENLYDGMTISNIREYNNKYKFTLHYKGMITDGCELPKTCTPQCENELCIKIINTAICGMYLQVDDVKMASYWFNGKKERSK